MRHRDDLVSIRVTEVVVTSGYADAIPTGRFKPFDDFPAPQIRPIARMLVRPEAPTIT
jgi:hypothetical protein